MGTVFITGASSGIGKETAKYFQRNGWNVIATMRNPQEETELNSLDNIKMIRCDVTDIESIDAAVADGINAFGSIDVLVNNAGYYAVGPLEAATDEQIRRQMDTNLIGTINVTKRMIPHFRERRAGIIMNVTSIAGLVSIPLQSLYHTTKWGLEGFSESLHYELRQFGIRVKIIEPGVIRTDFYGRSKTVLRDETLTEYNEYSERIMKSIMSRGEKGSPPEAVAATIYKAATDNRNKMRYRVGMSKWIVTMRRLLPFGIYARLMRGAMEK
jgi:NAD(P)-dependent dehydrogenase (short-subunit alcohol dehydrogenase family)